MRHVLHQIDMKSAAKYKLKKKKTKMNILKILRHQPSVEEQDPDSDEGEGFKGIREETCYCEHRRKDQAD